MRLELFEAQQATASGRYEEAAEWYLNYFPTIDREDASQLFEKFIKVVEEMTVVNNDCAKQLSLLLRCRNIYPDESIILNECARFFFIDDKKYHAFECAYDAIEDAFDVSLASALTNLKNSKYSLVKPSDWAVINDEERVSNYELAMDNVAAWRPECYALLIGSGLGVFASFAQKSFKGNVFCIEMNRHWGYFIREKLKQQVILKDLKEVTAADFEFKKLDVVIIDVMANGTLGEKALTFLQNLSDEFLSPFRTFIPKKVVAYACIVECPEISKENIATAYEYQFCSRRIWKCYGADEELSNNTQSFYQTSLVSALRGGYKVLSRIIEIFTVNLCSLIEINKIVVEGIMELRMAPIIEYGTAHAIVAWISCDLFPDIHYIDSSIQDTGNKRQAVFALPRPISLREGSMCTLQVKLHTNSVSCVLKDVVLPYDTSRSIEEQSTVIINYLAYAGFQNLVPCQTNDFLFMNDDALVRFFELSLTRLRQKIEFVEIEEPAHVLDITNLCTLSLKLIRTYPAVTFICYNHDSTLFPDSLTTDKIMDLFENIVDKEQEYMPDAFCPSVAKEPPRFYIEHGKTVDILIFWPISSQGFIMEAVLNRVFNFRLVNCQAGLIPASINVMGQVISCPDIIQQSRPDPEVYENIEIDKSKVEDLALSTYYNIEVSTLRHEVFSAPFQLLQLDFEELVVQDSTPRFMCSTNNISRVRIERDGTADGLLYWFDVVGIDHFYSTKSESNARCAISLFDRSRSVKNGDRLYVKSANFHGHLIFEFW
ncbi:unnamed protein product [Thelazia callipaeda]|uniref:TPR_REGION domain-containing protein n=1 Tax=Thelazia callipaeda TaxID=103827 RepID=A0A0N5CMJ5_THECL|nr:unnamed protein product [Thelazia callipaeda]